MGVESIGGECLEVDMTDVYKLGSEKKGNFEAEYIAELLQKGFNVESSSEDIKGKEEGKYYFTTYINGEKVTFDVLESTGDALKDLYRDNENYLLNRTISSRILNMFDLKESNELNEVIKSFEGDEMLVFYLLRIYARDILYENGRVLPEYLEDGNFNLELEIVKVLEGNDAIDISQLDRESLYGRFKKLGLREFIDESIKVESLNFDQRREEYLKSQFEKGKIEICDTTQENSKELSYELSDINEDIETENPDFMKWLDDNDFKQDIEKNVFVSPDGEIVLSFSHNMVTAIKTPIGGQNVDVPQFIKHFDRNGYRNY